MEKELELHEYKKFFDDTPVGLIRTDVKTSKVLMANKYCAEMLGFGNVEELIAKGKFSEMYPKDERQKMIQLIKKQGNVQGHELCLNRRDGRKVWVSASLHINCGGSCIEGSLIDITTQKEAEIELEKFRCCQLNKLSALNEKLDEAIDNYSG